MSYFTVDDFKRANYHVYLETGLALFDHLQASELIKLFLDYIRELNYSVDTIDDDEINTILEQILKTRMGCDFNE